MGLRILCQIAVDRATKASWTLGIRGPGPRRGRPGAGLRSVHHPGPSGEGWPQPHRAGSPGAAERPSRGPAIRRRGQGRFISASRPTVWRWAQAAVARAVVLGVVPAHWRVETHTFRHSNARHLLLHGIPIHYLSRWLGHQSIKTTLVYLELVPDPTSRLARVPWVTDVLPQGLSLGVGIDQK